MRRQCKCGKLFGYVCDFCESLNTKRSHTDRTRINCGNCFRQFPEDEKILDVVCLECQTRNLRESRMMREAPTGRVQ